MKPLQWSDGKRAACAASLLVSLVLGLPGLAFSQTDSKGDGSQQGLPDYETTQEQDKTLYEQGELKPGDAAPAIKVTSLTESGLAAAVPLSSLYKDKPLVVLMGSCTCGMTKDNLPKLNSTYEKFGSQANFAFIYMKDAHPNPEKTVQVGGRKVSLVQSKSIEHRIELARHLVHDTGLKFPVYVDDMKGSVRKAYEGFHNSAYIIDTNGKLVFAERYMYKAADVESALIDLLKAN